MERILVVDDESAMRLALCEVLTRNGYSPTAVENGARAIEELAKASYSLVLSDMRMPVMGGAELLAAVQQSHPGMPMVIMTAYGTIEDAVAAIKAGARDFLTKPFSPGDLLHLVRNILGDPTVASPAASALAPEPEPHASDRRIVTVSPAVERVLNVAEGVAASRAPVLIQGESGTGKELLARHIHLASPRRSQPFVAVNCAALPRELLESELFGHERGAFTGAIARKLGKFELANHGTILLDEVGELEAALQAKLLRVLQEHEVDRLGGTRPVAIDARVIATTNRSLRSMVAAGSFRRDLFYRLNVIPLTLPPLRERGEDVDVLIDHFCGRFASGRRIAIDPAARAYLRGHRWPGNVRELEHVLERALLLASSDRITVEDVRSDDDELEEVAAPAHQGEQMAPSLAGLTVHEVERRLIFETLKQTKNNRSHAARMLGISIRTLRNKLAEYRVTGHAEASA
jgi:two-component system response regulator FlrC